MDMIVNYRNFIFWWRKKYSTGTCKYLNVKVGSGGGKMMTQFPIKKLKRSPENYKRSRRKRKFSGNKKS